MADQIRLGMIGGGAGGFFGAAHRIASRIDDKFEMVAGALSSDAFRAIESGLSIGLDPARCYTSYLDMAEKEARRPDGIQAVSIVTPNFLHHRIAKAFVDRGIHVLCDKPLTTTIEDALDLAEAVARSRVVFAVSYTMAGFACVREARRIVRSGEIGRIRVVQAEFSQEWLATAAEMTGNKQAEWRTDPSRSGPGGTVADIGTHSFHLIEYVTGLQVESVAAQVSTFVPERRLDDNIQAMLRLKGGATGSLWVSQVAIGHTNGCRVRVFGDIGSIDWSIASPNELKISKIGEAFRILERASSQTTVRSRMPSGHPEGFLEALAQLYADFATSVHARLSECDAVNELLPDIDDGVRGVKFIEAVLRSGRSGSMWQDVDRGLC